jgi:hypothetical protein
MKNRLALNMIVGGGDAAVLERFFSSGNIKECFDEVVIVNTTSDPDVRSVIEKYADKTIDFKWSTEEYPFGNFAAARNAALDLTTSEYVQWNDADDIIAVENPASVYSKIKEVLNSHSKDFYVCPYILSIDNDGNAINVLERERIFKRCPTIRWTKAIHEQLTIDQAFHTHANLTGFSILHSPVKAGVVGINRNLNILKHEYFKANSQDRHISFYYARDLSKNDKVEAAVPILVDFINTFTGDLKNMYEAACVLARYYTYSFVKDGDETELRVETINLGERYIRIALAITEENAEPLVIYGDICLAMGKIEDSVKSYKMAMKKNIGTGNLQNVKYYKEIPARRLADVFLSTELYEQALWYNKVALDLCPGDDYLKEQRQKIIKGLK